MSHQDAKKWRLIRQETGPDLKLFRVRYDYLANPRNGQTGRMTVLEAEDSANVVALTPAQQILFVRQYRFGISDYTLELPGGIVDPGEAHGEAAQRELREEAGYTARRWQYLGSIPSNPVFMDSYIHHWMAEDAADDAAQQLDDEEEVELVLLPLDAARQMLYRGEFLHPHTVNALLLFFSNRQEKE
jgi:ADP-ribose pyrophosphatase